MHIDNSETYSPTRPGVWTQAPASNHLGTERTFGVTTKPLWQAGQHLYVKF